MLLSRNVDNEVKSLHEKGDLFSFFCQDLDHVKDFCAADLKAVLDTAHLAAVHEILYSKPAVREGRDIVIGKRHIIEAFKRTRPSLLPADKLKFNRFFQSFIADDMRAGVKEWNKPSMVVDDKGEEEYPGIKLKTSLK